MHIISKIVILAATTGACGLALTTPALADIPIAPYAQAAAQVNADGTIANSKNVTQVAKVATGKYCVQLNPDIPAARAVPTATLHSRADWRSEIYTEVQRSECANHSNSVFAYTGNNGAASDQPFSLLVP